MPECKCTPSERCLSCVKSDRRVTESDQLDILADGIGKINDVRKDLPK